MNFGSKLDYFFLFDLQIRKKDKRSNRKNIPINKSCLGASVAGQSAGIARPPVTSLNTDYSYVLLFVFSVENTQKRKLYGTACTVIF